MHTRQEVRNTLIAFIVAIAFGTAGCDPSIREHAPAATTSSAPSARIPEDLRPYPRGKWRLVPTSELGRVVLWVSHILVRHSESSTNAPLSFSDWRVFDGTPSRSRAEALALATTIARKVKSAPDRFAVLARARSDDVVTREAGGSLGGVTASELRVYPRVFDALAELKVNEVSRVVETRDGFHILHLRPVPEEQSVAARRIVVSYSGTSHVEGLERPPARRSRTEALNRAEHVASMLKDDPEQFEALLKRYSDHTDAAWGGDIGVWSNHEAGHLARARELLAKVAVHQVAGPIDGQDGYQVFLRTEATPRLEYAMKYIKLYFSLSDGKKNKYKSKEHVRKVALSISRMVTKNPRLFEKYQREHCCRHPQRWAQGRRWQRLTRAIARVTIGDIVRQPFEDENSFVIFQRVRPDAVPPRPAVQFEIPSPTTPSLMSFAGSTYGTAVQVVIRRIGKKAVGLFKLDKVRSEALTRAHEDLALKFSGEDSPKERKAALAAFFQELRRKLSKTQYREYEELARREVTITLSRKF